MIYKLYLPISHYNGTEIPNDRFLINNEGGIYDTVKHCFKSSSVQSKGYRMVSLFGKAYLVHRLVGEHFLPNPDRKPCIDHIDGCKINNIHTNLRFVSYKENNNNPITKERNYNSGGTWTKDNLPPNARAVYRIKGGERKWFPSSEEAARALGRNNSTAIRYCCNGLQEKSCGYYWEWA